MINSVLVITNKQDITSDFIIKELNQRAIRFYRFNTEELTKTISVSFNFTLSSFEITDSTSNTTYDLLEFTSVYYRRPELPTLEMNTLTPGEHKFVHQEIIYTLEGIYKILDGAFWISPLYSIRQAENKIYQLIIANKLGFRTPQSLVTTMLTRARDFFNNNGRECVIKPIKAGLIEETHEQKIIFTSMVENLPENSESFKSCPSFFQSHLKKKADVRVIVVGEEVFSTLIHSQENIETIVDWRRGETVLKHTKCKLPNQLENKCRGLLSKLQLQFGAIDFILDNEDNYTFLEINPNGQWAWIERQTGYEISKAIVNLLANEKY